MHLCGSAERFDFYSKETDIYFLRSCYAKLRNPFGNKIVQRKISHMVVLWYIRRSCLSRVMQILPSLVKNKATPVHRVTQKASGFFQLKCTRANVKLTLIYLVSFGVVCLFQSAMFLACIKRALQQDIITSGSCNDSHWKDWLVSRLGRWFKFAL